MGTGDREKQVAFSGIQPSGGLHLGNYLGAIKNWVDEQEQSINFFCIVDLHAVTVYIDPGELRQNIRSLGALYLASGLDPAHSTIFVQSHVSAHAELAWLLNCTTPNGWLGRMTQFKEKSAKQKENTSVGLYDYPVLQAADILLYQAHFVPVGEDQRQHIELTRDIAIRFNRLYGETFRVPEPAIRTAAARIMGLDDPTKKMSKSEANPNHAIYLLDPPDLIRKKIQRATTDSGNEIKFDPERPGVNNLLEIYQAGTGQSRGWIEEHFAGQGYSTLKREVADAVIARLEPLQQRYAELTADPAIIDKLFADGAEKANAVASRTLRRAQERMGLR